MQPGMVGPRQTAARRWLDLFEGGRNQSWNWLALLIVWIVLRNLLEGVFERPATLGFDWREDVSLAMMVLHLPLFYLALFLLLSLWLHLVSGRPLGRVARAVAMAYAVLLVAPIIDALVSGGPGYELRYLTGPGGFLIHFWHPLRAVDEVSPGQRVEIAAACLLAAVYVATARRAAGTRSAAGRAATLLRAAAAALGVYVLAAAVGIWPALLARLAAPTLPTELTPYETVYRMGGLIGSESRRLAVALLVPALAALPIFLWRLRPERFAPVLRRLPWTRLLHYSAAAPLGSYLGYLVFRDYVPGLFANPLDWVAVVALWAAVAAAVLAAVAWNDLHDCDADRINDPCRPLVSGLLQPAAARRWAAAGCAIALYVAWIVSYPALLLVSACLLLAWLYSAPPLRLKRAPGIATAALALLTALAAMTGFSLVAGEATVWAFPRRVLWLLLAGITLGFTAKDLKDREGDAATGVVTVATLLPPQLARACTALLVGAGYLLAPLLLPLGPHFTAIAAVFAAVGIAFTLRLRRPDAPLLLSFVVFALILAALLDGRADLLRERPPDGRLAALGEVVHLEREVLMIDQLERAGLPAAARREAAAVRVVALPADAAPPERLDVLAARLAPPAQARAASARLVAQRPLQPLHWDLRFRAAMLDEGPGAAAAVARQALARLVRPGQFLANLAGLELDAAGASAPAARYLAGAFLFHVDPGLLRVLWGDLRLFEGRPRESAAAYGRALAWAPRSADAWAGLGRAEHAQGRLQEALAAFDRAGALEPRDPWVANNRGVALRDLGRLDDALIAFRRAHDLAPSLPEAALNLGLTCEALGQVDAARSWFAIALALRPEWGPAAAGSRRLGEGGSE
ncbi:MAG: UbiA family prenyltransferase [Candidatus Krumholzibacteria bacterium]|jgi:4-hydroxybenzoate polyprenyltransferase/tetratricopeptide (TPR) repeat protein|nr:UbiA family prenyltransferase [Candidatus Krumholzibacteria bacterium]